jgi:hypothetical protein
LDKPIDLRALKALAQKVRVRSQNWSGCFGECCRTVDEIEFVETFTPEMVLLLIENLEYTVTELQVAEMDLEVLKERIRLG